MCVCADIMQTLRTWFHRQISICLPRATQTHASDLTVVWTGEKWIIRKHRKTLLSDPRIHENPRESIRIHEIMRSHDLGSRSALFSQHALRAFAIPLRVGAPLAPGRFLSLAVECKNKGFHVVPRSMSKWCLKVRCQTSSKKSRIWLHVDCSWSGQILYYTFRIRKGMKQALSGWFSVRSVRDPLSSLYIVTRCY